VQAQAPFELKVTGYGGITGHTF